MKLLIRISIIYQYATSADSTLSLSSSDCPVCTHTVLLVVTTPTHEHAQALLRQGCSLHAELLKVHVRARRHTCIIFPTYGTHPSGFTLVFNGLLGIRHRPLHIVYRVLHIILYTVYHLPLREASCKGGDGAGHSRGGGGAEWEAGEKKRKRVGGREITGQSEEGVHLISHPFAGLFELFAFGDALLRLLHILLSLLHPVLYVVHQSSLQECEKTHSAVMTLKKKSQKTKEWMTDFGALSAMTF